MPFIILKIALIAVLLPSPILPKNKIIKALSLSLILNSS